MKLNECPQPDLSGFLTPDNAGKDLLTSISRQKAAPAKIGTAIV
jgi:hypothetical protein